MKLLKLAFVLCLAWTSAWPDTSSRPYITAATLGGLGNVLFQVATTSAVAWDHDADAYFPQLGEKPSLYSHVFSRCKIIPPSNATSIVCSEGETIEFQPGMKLSGYFQEERYFSHHREKLIELFAPTPTDVKYIARKYGNLLSQPDTVGVQIRYYRREVVDGFPQYGKQYLAKALAQFPSFSTFIVSTDNIQFARDQMPDWVTNVHYLEGEKDYIDFYILTLCKHNLITNSSFGWWAAWLNQNPNKRVVCPAYWTGFANDRIFPKDWIRIEAPAEEL